MSLITNGRKFYQFYFRGNFFHLKVFTVSTKWKGHDSLTLSKSVTEVSLQTKNVYCFEVAPRYCHFFVSNGFD